MAKDHQELELKFSGTMPALSALPESAVLRALAPAGGRWERLKSVYFDTPDGSLNAAGVSLRQRYGTAGSVQTVKLIGAGGVVDRGEWEQDLSTPATFPAMTGKAKIDHLLSVAAPSLRPVTEIRIDRWYTEFKYKTSVLEIAVDLGCAAAVNEDGAMTEGPIGEVELELISGDPADLFLAARLLLDNAPLRLHACSKLETAALIASGRRLAVPKFKSFSAGASDDASGALRRALIMAAERIIALQTPILDARTPEGIHRMRVELRRFRAIERIFRRAADCSPLRHLAEKAGFFARALGPARDWDVFLDQTLPAVAENGYAVAGLARLKAKAQSHRAKAWAAASTQINDPAFSIFALDLLAAAHLKPWRAKRLDLPARGFAVRALDHSLRKAGKIARRVDPANPVTLHPLRIALKKLRYGVQLFRGIYPKPARENYMAKMAALQEAFGIMNDAIVAQMLANQAAEGAGEEAMRAAGFICGYYAARAEVAAKEIDAAWIEFEKKEPFWRE